MGLQDRRAIEAQITTLSHLALNLTGPWPAHHIAAYLDGHRLHVFRHHHELELMVPAGQHKLTLRP
jgi:hypothetical protein